MVQLFNSSMQQNDFAARDKPLRTQSCLRYSLILSCLCIRSTFRSLYWVWMVLQWPINSTNSLDKTPCWRRGDIQGQRYCTFNIQTNLLLCVEVSSFDQWWLKRTCVLCIRICIGTYLPSSSPFLISMPGENWLMSYNKFKPSKETHEVSENSLFSFLWIWPARVLISSLRVWSSLFITTEKSNIFSTVKNF